MVGLTPEIADKVSFCRQDHHVHLCPQMKQILRLSVRRSSQRSVTRPHSSPLYLCKYLPFQRPHIPTFVDVHSQKAMEHVIL